MTETSTVEKVDAEKVRAAIKKIAEHGLHRRIKGVTGNQSHIVLPEIWPIINEFCAVSDACEAGMITVKD